MEETSDKICCGPASNDEIRSKNDDQSRKKPKCSETDYNILGTSEVTGEEGDIEECFLQRLPEEVRLF
jgi:hypothetical protein